MLCADIKSTVFKITAPGLSNRHVLLLCWKNYVSCYASTSEYSSVLAHNSVDFFFFSNSSSITRRNGLTWEVALSSQMTAIICQKDTRSLGIFLHLIYYCSCSVCYYFCYGNLASTIQLHADSETIQACRTYSHGVRLLPPTSRVCTWTFHSYWNFENFVREPLKVTCNCSL